jgi:hypothetical protein
MAKRIGRKQRVSRIKKGMSRRRGQGLRISGKVPYGYQLAEDGKSLVPNDAEQEVLYDITMNKWKGYGYRWIADVLNEDGITTRKGGRWHASTIRSVYLTGRKWNEAFGGKPFEVVKQRRDAIEDSKSAAVKERTGKMLASMLAEFDEEGRSHDDWYEHKRQLREWDRRMKGY